jgi:hypothetical protein
VRSSCETVETKSGSSRVGHDRLAQREPGLLAAATDRNKAAPTEHLAGLERPAEDLLRRAAQRVRGRHAGDALRGGIPEDDLPLAVDGHDAVGDVGEDGLAALLLVAHTLVELGIRAGGGRRRGERVQRLGLFLAPFARGAAVDGEDPVHRFLGPDDGNSQVRGVAARQHRIRVEEAGVVPDVRDRPRRARLDDVAHEPPRRRRTSADGVRLAYAGRGPDDDLVALEHANRRAVSGEQLDGVAHGLVQHVVRIELPGELPAGPREPLRKRPGAALTLEELTALEGSASGAGDVAGQLELLLGEDLLAREEHEHEP